MSIFTFMLGISELTFFGIAMVKWQNGCIRCLLVPIGFGFMVMTCYGPFLVRSWAEKYAWDHGCNSFPVQIVLQAAGCFGTNLAVAHYFIDGSPMYTYQLDRSNFLNFSLQTIDSSSLATNFSSPEYPSIHSIAYDFVNKTIAGNCTSPTIAPNSTIPCLSGTFYPSNNHLSFNMTDSRENSSSYLRGTDKEWFFNEDPPRLVLEDEGGTTVLETDVASRCTLLKVCMGKRDAGPETIVPIALVLWKQMDFASYCDCGNHADQLV
ncbi:hypothetical protein JAAARDRAFT_712541 [Jaapia argillacea MUCL 33604]|uniref:Uncharacterized protein n=1 Tax=Jaapia argillacea MUCL 33604 TaxID=933084 RepID=A0A067Q2Y0_9AGAM|nr:hypothetical protein JAAARDRAFT_712541 [Jaapia argillacea MUCL 33604]